ncbi:similar to ATPase (AAA+ superfamily) [hydrothermal vent metagenome]|uniref:Similar to ATPase (AAA+ superfamily) n=1 Tax=hydrothermal vent metagenome TaxID=652676 RepID=A0A1W1E063_9ZZZZ
MEIKWSDLVVKDARKLKSFIKYIKQNEVLDNTVTTKTITQERIIDNTLIDFIPSALYAYILGKNSIIPFIKTNGTKSTNYCPF